MNDKYVECVYQLEWPPPGNDQHISQHIRRHLSVGDIASIQASYSIENGGASGILEASS